MDQAAAIIILNVSVPEYGKVVVETTDGMRYLSDLLSLSKVYCFPKNLQQWQQVSIDNDGLALIWTCRFEAHIDQILALAVKKEKLVTSHQNQQAQI